ncbi:MAG TPA: FecR domain-containing protein [Polyangiales bacterium]|nr:FecR domain-containing protein [Polyangiales bacterium]
MTEPVSQRDGFTRLGELARQVASQPVTAAQHATGRMRVMVAAAGLSRGERGWRLPLPLVAAAAAILLSLGGIGFYAHWQSRPLTYEVVGGQRFATNYVGAHASQPARVMFSDGSEIDARPGSRLRIDDTSSDGARVLVERGTAAARVRHRERSRWTFAAGPFDVKVIGTKFDLDWDPVGQVVTVTLHEGAVEVASPVGQSTCIVRAGQRFQASVPAGTMTLENIEDLPPTRVSRAAPPSVQPAIAAAVVAPAPPARPSAVRSDKHAHAEHSLKASPKTWSGLVRRGEFQAVVDQALAGDLDELLATCRPAEARALADAARYTDRSALAERTLLVMRKRFPDTGYSSAAGFLLGRTSETLGEPAEADRWYQTYLDEAPSGQYAADALAGRMRSLFAKDGAQAAEPVAREYLRRFPEGVHLRMARRLAGQP